MFLSHYFFSKEDLFKEMEHNAVLKFTALDSEAEAFEKDKASAQNEIDECDLLIKR